MYELSVSFSSEQQCIGEQIASVSKYTYLYKMRQLLSH